MLRLSGPPPARLITLGNRAREAKQWDIASNYYQKSLNRNPRNSAIWVQYGHALKESGHLAEAAAAYRQALAYEPEAADSHLQLGHVLKLQGKIEDAKAAYQQSLVLVERLSAEPTRELAELGSSESEAPDRSDTLPIMESKGIVGENPQNLFERKDITMRNVFDGIVKATCPDIICDIGSYDGYESARFSEMAPGSHVYAFEANQNNILDLMKTRRDLEHVTIEYTVVSELDGLISFYIPENDGRLDDWRRAAGSLNVRTDNVASACVTVPSVRLDTYFKKAIEDKSTFVLWIDVEGALDRVFAGAQRVLSQTILFRAEVERREFWADQRMAEEIISLAERAGFTLLADSWTHGAHEQSDVLMINRQWLHLATRSANR